MFVTSLSPVRVSDRKKLISQEARTQTVIASIAVYKHSHLFRKPEIFLCVSHKLLHGIFHQYVAKISTYLLQIENYSYIKTSEAFRCIINDVPVV